MVHLPDINRGLVPVRPRAWLGYGVTDQIAISATLTVPFVFMSGQLGAQWNPIRTRYVDFATSLRAGFELCTDWAILSYERSSVCKSSAWKGGVSGHTAAIAQLGFNPFSWLTIQAQGGVWTQHKDGERAGPWLGGNAYVMLGDNLALGPDIAVLPGWFDDGRALVQPSLSLVAWPKRGSNPYRDP